MRHSIFPLLACLLCAALLLPSCQSDPAPSNDQLLGRWELTEAFRSGRPTESLDQLYFEFLEDGSMLTNLTGSTMQATYEVNGNTIAQISDQIAADYTIEAISDSTLTLTTKLRDFDFRFVLKKGTASF